jgi:hypothetical protein
MHEGSTGSPLQKMRRPAFQTEVILKKKRKELFMATSASKNSVYKEKK